MSVPKWYWFIDPVLRTVAESTAVMRRKEIILKAPARMNLSEEQMAELAGKGRQTRVHGRAGWAISYAKRAGLLDSPRRATYALADAGRAVLAQFPDGIPEEKLLEIKAEADKKDIDDDGKPPIELENVGEHESGDTPDERLQRAYEEIRASVRDELLDTIRRADPLFFEKLVLDVLHAMGYGANREDLQETSAGGDGGIDGIISLDRLGLEKVYVQAKRYAADNHVSRPAVQGFLGALAGRRATKGVLITTSRFSGEAREFATTASDSLVLVNGNQLADLMIEYGVGVARRKVLTLVSIDSDYFEDA